MSLFLEHITREGAGPRLHRHPYDETFVVYEGAARFTVADETVEVHAGQILVAPALVPHKFVTLAEYRAHHIHANDRFVTGSSEPTRRVSGWASYSATFRCRPTAMRPG